MLRVLLLSTAPQFRISLYCTYANFIDTLEIRYDNNLGKCARVNVDAWRIHVQGTKDSLDSLKASFYHSAP